MQFVFVLVFFVLALSVLPARAEDNTTDLPNFWDWPTMLGWPGGPREALSDAGIDINAWLTQTYEGIISGDGSHEWQYGGKATITANFDGEKLGLWPGFSANIIYEHIYGDDLNADDSVLLPANGIMAFPRVGGYDDDFSFTISQQFGDAFNLSVGKFNLLHLVAKTPLVGGGGEETFLNAAMAGPITGVVPPYLFGAVANIHTEFVDYTAMIYDPRNAQDWDVVEDPFTEGVTFLLSATVPTQIAGLPGYYGVRGIYSTAEGLDLSRVPELAGLPPESQDTLTRDGKWYFNIATSNTSTRTPTYRATAGDCSPMQGSRTEIPT